MGHIFRAFENILENRLNFINLIQKFAWKLNNFGKYCGIVSKICLKFVALV